MGFGDRDDCLVVEKLRGVATSSERIPALNHDSEALDIGDDVVFLIIGVNLVLDECGRDVDLREEVFELLNISV